MVEFYDNSMFFFLKKLNFNIGFLEIHLKFAPYLQPKTYFYDYRR